MADAVLNLSDPRGPNGDQRGERSPLALLGNGKAGWLKQMLVGAALSALVSLAVAGWIARDEAADQVKSGLAVLEERQKNQNAEVIRRLDELKADIRDIRK